MQKPHATAHERQETRGTNGFNLNRPGKQNINSNRHHESSSGASNTDIMLLDPLPISSSSQAQNVRMANESASNDSEDEVDAHIDSKRIPAFAKVMSILCLNVIDSTLFRRAVNFPLAILISREIYTEKACWITFWKFFYHTELSLEQLAPHVYTKSDNFLICCSCDCAQALATSLNWSHIIS